MSKLNAGVDLGGLTREPTLVNPPRRRVLRIVIPLLIVLGFVAVLATTIGDFFRKQTLVTFQRPTATESSAVAGGTVLFQAAGWAEPDPFPIRILPLTAGVLKDVLVQPSDKVLKDQVIARLVPDDARIAQSEAEAELAAQRAEHEQGRVELDFAEESLATLLELRETKGMSEAEVEGRRAEAEHRSQSVVKAEALLRLAVAELDLAKHLASENAAGPRQVEVASAKVDEARGDLALMRADAALAQAEARKAEIRRDRAAKELELRLMPRNRVAAAKAALKLSEAKVLTLERKLEAQKLRSERLEVRSPMDGVVLTRPLPPGAAVSPEGADALPICQIYDPSRLRVRVDVRQEQVGLLLQVKEALIVSEARADRPYKGLVQRVVQEADIVKTTLQVQVQVLEPDELVRPEMICQVRFLAPKSDEKGVTDSNRKPVVLIQKRLLVDPSHVFVIDPIRMIARKRSVKAGMERGDDIEILEGLNITDKVIDEGRLEVRDGDGVKTREDR